MGFFDAMTSFITGNQANQQNQRNQETEWQREDTAMQRKVTDLKAAGLNPVLAATSGGASSSLTTSQQPIRTDMGNVGQNAANAWKAYQEAKLAREQQKADLQAKKNNALLSLAQAQESVVRQRLMDWQATTESHRAGIAAHDLNYWYANPLPSTATTGYPAQFMQMLKMMQEGQRYLKGTDELSKRKQAMAWNQNANGGKQ